MTDSWISRHPARSGVLARWATQGLNVLAALVTIPLLLASFGTEGTGIWYFMLSWGAVLLYADFGISDATSRQIASSLGSGDERAPSKESRFLSISGQRAGVVTFLSSQYLMRRFVFLVICFAIIAERTFLFTGTMQVEDIIRPTWYLVALGNVGILLARPYQTMLRGFLLPSWEAIGIFVSTLFSRGLFIGVLFAQSPMWMVGLAFCIGGWLEYGAARILSQKYLADQMAVEATAKKGVVKALWHLGWPQGVTDVSIYFIISVNPILIGYFLGADQVAVYAIVARIAAILLTASKNIAVARLNFLIKLLHDHRYNDFIGQYASMAIFSSAFAFVVFSVFAIAGQQIISVITNGKILAPVHLFIVFAILNFMTTVQTMAGLFVLAHGVQRFVRIAILGAVLNLCLGVLLIPSFGIIGSAWGTFGALLGSFVWFAPYLAFKLICEYREKLAASEIKRIMVSNLRSMMQLSRPR